MADFAWSKVTFQPWKIDVSMSQTDFRRWILPVQHIWGSTQFWGDGKLFGRDELAGRTLFPSILNDEIDQHFAPVHDSRRVLWKLARVIYFSLIVDKTEAVGKMTFWFTDITTLQQKLKNTFLIVARSARPSWNASWCFLHWPRISVGGDFEHLAKSGQIIYRLHRIEWSFRHFGLDVTR